MVLSDFIRIASHFLLCSLFFSITIPSVYAQEIHYFLGSSVKASDNIIKNSDPVSGQEFSIKTGISGFKQGSIFKAGGDIDLNYLIRNKSLFNDPEELRGDGVLFLNLSVLPNVIGWENRLVASTTLLDPRQSANADNLTNQISYNTGPYWNLKLSQVDKVFFSSNYNYVKRENLSSNERFTTNSSWKHFVKKGYFSLNHIFNNVQSTNLVSGYRTDEIYVDLNQTLRFFSFNLGIGEKVIKSDDFESEDLDPTIRSSLNWRPFNSVQFNLKYSLVYEDDISQSNELAFSDIENIKISTSSNDNPFQFDAISVIRKVEGFVLGYQQSFLVSNISLQYAKSTENNLSAISFLNIDQTSFNFVASRKLNPLTQIHLKQYYLENLFEQGEITKKYISTLQLNKSLSKKLHMIFELIFENSSSDFETAEYDEVSGFVSLKFTDIF